MRNLERIGRAFIGGKPSGKSSAALQAHRLNNPAQLPKYFRELVREQMAAPALERLRQTAMGELRFKRPMVVNKAVQIVECEANEITQRQALVDLLNIALPRHAGFVDDDGNSQTGVIILPALDRDDSIADTPDYEIVEEEMKEGSLPLSAPSGEAVEETIPPAVVAQVVANRRGKRSGER